MTKTKVFIDVENTLSVPFISGIQRVTRELVKEFILQENSVFEFIPVFHCPYCDAWIESGSLDIAPGLNRPVAKGKSQKIKNLLPGLLVNVAKNIISHIRHLRSGHAHRRVTDFGEASVFFDLDSSWHNPYKRSKLLPKLKEKRFTIVTLHHDAIPILMPELSHPNTVKVFQDHFYAHLKYSDLFLCNSKNTQNDLVKCAEKIQTNQSIVSEVVRFGDFENVDCKTDYPHDLWASLNLTGKFVLCVATIEPRKNHHTLLDAFDIIYQKNKELVLLLVGREGWQSDEIINRITQHPQYGSRLMWIQDVEDSDLAMLYRNAFINLSTSLYEGFGLPVSEGLSHGCVTIASDKGAIVEICGEYIDQIDPMDSTALVDKVLNYLKNPDQHNERKQWVASRSKYNWSETARQITCILERFI